MVSASVGPPGHHSRSRVPRAASQYKRQGVLDRGVVQLLPPHFPSLYVRTCALSLWGVEEVKLRCRRQRRSMEGGSEGRGMRKKEGSGEARRSGGGGQREKPWRGGRGGWRRDVGRTVDGVVCSMRDTQSTTKYVEIRTLTAEEPIIIAWAHVLAMTSAEICHVSFKP